MFQAPITHTRRRNCSHVPSSDYTHTNAIPECSELQSRLRAKLQRAIEVTSPCLHSCLCPFFQCCFCTEQILAGFANRTDLAMLRTIEHRHTVAATLKLPSVNLQLPASTPLATRWDVAIPKPTITLHALPFQGQVFTLIFLNNAVKPFGCGITAFTFAQLSLPSNKCQKAGKDAQCCDHSKPNRSMSLDQRKIAQSEVGCRIHQWLQTLEIIRQGSAQQLRMSADAAHGAKQ